MNEKREYLICETKNQELWLKINIDQIDASNSYELRSQIIEIIKDETPKRIVMNLEKLVYIDSTGLGIFVSILKRTSERNIELIIKNPVDKVLSLFNLTRLDKVFKIEK